MLPLVDRTDVVNAAIATLWGTFCLRSLGPASDSMKDHQELVRAGPASAVARGACRAATLRRRNGSLTATQI